MTFRKILCISLLSLGFLTPALANCWPSFYKSVSNGISHFVHSKTGKFIVLSTAAVLMARTLIQSKRVKALLATALATGYLSCKATKIGEYFRTYINRIFKKSNTASAIAATEAQPKTPQTKTVSQEPQKQPEAPSDVQMQTAVRRLKKLLDHLSWKPQ